MQDLTPSLFQKLSEMLRAYRLCYNSVMAPRKLVATPLEKALRRLEKSYRIYQSDLSQSNPELREEFRSATIQSFEFTYEMACTMIRRQLADIEGSAEELRQLNFADVIRRAARAGLIPDVKRFLDYRDQRNQTSHVYDEKVSESVVSVVDSFLTDIRYLLHEIQKRNPS